MLILILMTIVAVLLVLCPFLIFIARIVNKLNTQKCDCKNDLNGKIIVMTGSNTGIGLYAAAHLSFRNPGKIIIGCRDVQKTETLINNLKKTNEFNPKTEVLIKELDLLSLSKVRNFCSDILINESRIDILVLNAGAGSPYGRNLTEDQLEMQFQQNHLSHFLMTTLFLDRLIESSRNYANGPSRIIVTSSLAHTLGKIDLKNIVSFNNYIQHPFKTYSDTKLLNVLFTVELARRLNEDKLNEFLTINCFEPAEDAAQNIVHLACSSEVQEINGGYFSNCKLSNPSKSSKNLKLSKECWELSEKICEQQLYKWQKVREEKGRYQEQLKLRNRTLERRQI